MNLELLQSTGQMYPDHLESTLECGSEAITCSCNRRGTLLAVGCNDGRIVVFDFLTRVVAKIYTGHVHPVTSLSWSRDGYKLLSTSTDNNVSIWDVLSGECEQRYHFSSPILRAQFHPRDRQVVLVCPIWNSPVLVKIAEQHKHTSLPTDGESEQNIVASFTHKGVYIYMGLAKGRIIVIKYETLEIVRSFKVSAGSTAIKSFEFARRGGSFLVNCADRIIRVYSQDTVMSVREGEDPEPEQKLQDLVNRTLWKKCCFSGDGEYIVAGSYQEHALYIWDKTNGSLVKILSGQKGENMLDVVWHPIRPIITSISNGMVHVWDQNQVENWSAFAPDFKELEENEEYEERESEFDLEDEDRSVGSVEQEGKSGDEFVDVTTVQPIPAFCSSDEDPGTEEGGLYWLPTVPEVDDPEDGPGWGQLEPSLSNLENLEHIAKRPLDSPPSPDIPSKKMRTIDIPLANNCEQKPFNDKKSFKKPPIGPLSSNKSRSATKKGKSKSATRKRPDKKRNVSNSASKVEPSGSSEFDEISPSPTDATKDPPMPPTNPTSSYTEDNSSKIEVLEYGSVFKDLETSSSGSDDSSDRLSRRDSNENLSNSSSSSSSEDSDS